MGDYVPNMLGGAPPTNRPGNEANTMGDYVPNMLGGASVLSGRRMH